MQKCPDLFDMSVSLLNYPDKLHCEPSLRLRRIWRSSLKYALVSIILAFCGSCSIRSINHSPDTAAINAVEFAYVGFVQRDSNSAYQMLAPLSQQVYSKEKIRSVLDEMHGRKSPLGVTAYEYQPVYGTELVIIFLRGENGEEVFHYRVEMFGNAEQGYKPSGFYRDFTELQQSDLRQPLRIKRSAGR